MSEIQIANNKVYPYLKKLGIPEDLIEGYGRVPIQLGTSVVWADYVCYYYSRIGERKPYAVIEIKECGDQEIYTAIPQAESYAQMIDAPFFCCTNGNKFYWYLNGKAQGDYLPLQSIPPLPDQEFLIKPEKMFISPYLYEAIRNFESNLILGTHIYEDTKLVHHKPAEELNEALWDDSILKSPDKMIKILDNTIMKGQSKLFALESIKDNYDVFLKMVAQLKDDSIPKIESINNFLGKNSPYGMSYVGIFFITQLLAGLYPMEYTVIEQSAVNCMERFNLIDIRLDPNTAEGYLYFNEICRNLFLYFKNEYDFNLSLVHNFLWHYEREFLHDGKWS